MNFTENSALIEDSINAMNTFTGSSCIACALDDARLMFANFSRSFVQKVVILFTDGNSNSFDDQLQSRITQLENVGAVIFAFASQDIVNNSRVISIQNGD